MTETTDSQIGKNLRALRLGAEMTQVQLAESLTEAGFPVHQQTILKIENGSRSLKLTEASALAEILNTRVERLLRRDDLSELSAEIRSLQRSFEVARERVLSHIWLAGQFRATVSSMEARHQDADALREASVATERYSLVRIFREALGTDSQAADALEKELLLKAQRDWMPPANSPEHLEHQSDGDTDGGESSGVDSEEA